MEYFRMMVEDKLIILTFRIFLVENLAENELFNFLMFWIQYAVNEHVLDQALFIGL